MMIVHSYSSIMMAQTNLVNPNKNVSVLHSLILFLSFQCTLEYFEVSFENFQIMTFICNHLFNVVHIILQRLQFKALLILLSFASSSSSIARQPQELVISSDPSIPIVDLNANDIIFNPITTGTQLCKLGDGKPWRGPKEKSEQLMQLFIIGLSLKNGIVTDLTASASNQYFYTFHFLTTHHCFILIIFPILLLIEFLHTCSSRLP
jgi:hypothetical protein